MKRSERQRRLRIFETKYGREGGWWLDCGNRHVAELTEPRWLEDSWHSYKFTILTEDPEEVEKLRRKEFWDKEIFRRYVLRSREFGDVADGAFTASGGPFLSDGRIVLRGDYLSIEPTSWERVILWWRRFRSRKRCLSE